VVIALIGSLMRSAGIHCRHTSRGANEHHHAASRHVRLGKTGV
jgi:hypothetical protein